MLQIPQVLPLCIDAKLSLILEFRQINKSSCSSCWLLPLLLPVRNDTPLWLSRRLTAAMNWPLLRNARITSNREIWQQMLLVGRLGLRLPPDVLLVDSDVQPYLWQPECGAAQTETGASERDGEEAREEAFFC